MKFKEVKEMEKEFRAYFIDDNNEEDYIIITLKYDDDTKKWLPHLSGEYEEEELDVVRKIAKEINSKGERYNLNLEEKKK